MKPKKPKPKPKKCSSCGKPIKTEVIRQCPKCVGSLAGL